ncbi:MAG: GFA family protein [Halieaceae bacterium]|nr:GFA family protein [Halieaceae bacterium]
MCACGDISITFSGEPQRVFRCHCDYCQKRTGSVFQVSAWFPMEQVVAKAGEPRVFSEHNMLTEYMFCARCGSTVYWVSEYVQGIVCAAVGCFVDAHFPKPTLDIQNQYRHGWVEAIEGVPEYEGFWTPDE